LLKDFLTSSYLIGPENVSQALINGIAPCDNRTSTSLTRYFLDFAGCDFSPEDVNVSVSSFDINNPNKTPSSNF
ncbi:6864_t:CDS:2, partial [Scutellospora calospora]